MKKWTAAPGLVGALACGQVMADNNGIALLAQCQDAIRFMDTKATDSHLGTGMCLGMVEGVRSTMYLYNHLIPEQLQSCLPEQGISNAQAIRIVVKFLQDRPEELDKDATVLTVAAFRSAYLCK